MRPCRFFLLVFALAMTSLSTGTMRAAAEASAPVHPSGGLLDINTASAAQLKALPGMGDAYVQRIIQGRPYAAKNQLVSRGILPQVAYDKVQANIIAKHPAK